MRHSFAARGAGIAPTRIGVHLHRIARPLVEGLERLPDLFEEHHTGVAAEVLRIGAGQISGGYVLPEFVRRFQARFPRTRIEVHTGTGAERMNWLRGFELDLVDRRNPVPCPATSPSIRWCDADMVVVTPQGPSARRADTSASPSRRSADHRLVAQPAGRYQVRTHPGRVARAARGAPARGARGRGVGLDAQPRRRRRRHRAWCRSVCVSADEPVCRVAIEPGFRLAHLRGGDAPRRAGLSRVQGGSSSARSRTTRRGDAPAHPEQARSRAPASHLLRGDAPRERDRSGRAPRAHPACGVAPVCASSSSNSARSSSSAPVRA